MGNDYVLVHPTDSRFSDLYLCFCGYEKCEPLHGYGIAVRPNYIIHYILEGRGKYQVDGRTYELEAGQGFLIEPGVPTFYQADAADPWTYVWVGFGGKFAGEYLRDIGLTNNRPIFRCSRSNDLKEAVLTMLKNNKYTMYNQFLLESQLYLFFSILASDIDVALPFRENRESVYVSKAVEFIQNNYPYKIHVSDIADYVCINRSYLYTLFKKTLNVSPQEYLADFRLTRAQELLGITDMSVESVGMSCGYQDPLVFSKAFKQKMGQTPSAFRKNSKKRNEKTLENNREKLEQL